MNITQKTGAELFAPPARSYMIAHWIFRGREFKRNDARTNRFRLADHLGIPYIVVNIRKSKDRCHLLLQKGFNCNDRHWTVADGWIRSGDGGTFLLFPADHMDAPRTPAEYKEALHRKGVFTNESDHRKFEKYFKRDQAPYMASYSGPVAEQDSTHVVANLVFRGKNGQLNVRKTFFRMPKVAARMEFAVDGRLYVSTGCASLMVGREVMDGEGFIGHVVMPGRFYKGIIEARSDMHGWDFWLYAGKKQLHSDNEVVTVTFLSELHVAPLVYSDIQSAIALDYVEQLPKYALEAMFGFQDALNDEAKMSEMVDKIAQSMEANDVEADDSERETVWSLIQAQRAGLPLTGLPVLRQKLLRFFTTRMVNMTKFRVPLPASCMRRYLSLDRFAFDEEGNINMSNTVLKNNECVVPGPGLADIAVAVQRQPIAGPQEQAFLQLVTVAEYNQLGSQCPFVYISMDVLEDVLCKLGGGDLDDPSIIRTDLAEINRLRDRFAGHHYQVSESGNETVATVTVKPVSEVNPFTSRRQTRITHSVEDPMGRLRKLINVLVGVRGDISIGEVSNYIMIDITNQNEGRYAQPLLPRCTSNLEGVIDSSQHVMKDGELAKSALVTEIATFKETVPCVEKQLFYRLPASVRGNVEVYEGTLTRTRELIEKRIAQWKEDMSIESMDKIFSVLPMHLVEVSSPIEAVNLVFEMKRFAKAKMDENIQFEIPGVTEQFRFDGYKVENPDVQKSIESEAAINAYKTTEEELYERYNQHPLRMQAVAEWLKQSWISGEKFSARKTDGTGFLAGNHTIRWMIEAWRLLGTSDPSPITLLPEAVLAQCQGRFSLNRKLNTQVSSVSLRFGWQKKGLAIDAPEVVEAKAKASQRGQLVPVKFGNMETFECVLEDGTHFGIVPVTERYLLDGRVYGTLTVHPTQAYGMLFTFDQVPVTPEPVVEVAAEVAGKENTFAVVSGLEQLDYSIRENDIRLQRFHKLGEENEVVTLFSCLFLNTDDGDWEDAVAVVAGDHQEIPTVNAAFRLPDDLTNAGLEIIGWIPRPQVVSVLDIGDLLHGMLTPGGPFTLKVEVL